MNLEEALQLEIEDEERRRGVWDATPAGALLLARLELLETITWISEEMAWLNDDSDEFALSIDDLDESTLIPW